MATIKVLLAGGRAAGRILEVDETKTTTVVNVPALPSWGPDVITEEPVGNEAQIYQKTERQASGYPVWEWVKS